VCSRSILIYNKYHQRVGPFVLSMEFATYWFDPSS